MLYMFIMMWTQTLISLRVVGQWRDCSYKSMTMLGVPSMRSGQRLYPHCAFIRPI